jgi:hypothetical protein
MKGISVKMSDEDAKLSRSISEDLLTFYKTRAKPWFCNA